MQGTVSLAANGQVAFNVPHGTKYVSILSAQAGADLEIDRTGRQAIFQGASFGGGKIKRLVFFDTSGASNTVAFYYGAEEYRAPDVVSAQTPSAPVSAVYVIQANDTVEQIAPGSVAFVTSIEFFPGSAVVGGVITANALGDVYIGRTATQLPYKRATTDTDYPAVFVAPPGQKIALADFYVRGKAGDGVAYTYTPA